MSAADDTTQALPEAVTEPEAAPAEPAGTVTQDTPEPTWQEVMAAGIAAREAEIDQEIAADMAAYTEAEAAFLIEADARFAAARQANYSDAGIQRRNALLDEAQVTYRALAARHGATA